METPILKDPDIVPTKDVLENELGELYPVYREFMETLKSDTFGLSPEWRYYKDGKAWLCKISRKKKTVVWMSAWEGFFRLGFYFTDKTGTGIPDLEIDPALKESYRTNKPIGRLKPLVVDVHGHSDLADAFAVITYKSSLK
jgi:hypothetical protein